MAQSVLCRSPQSPARVAPVRVAPVPVGWVSADPEVCTWEAPAAQVEAPAAECTSAAPAALAAGLAVLECTWEAPAAAQVVRRTGVQVGRVAVLAGCTTVVRAAPAAVPGAGPLDRADPGNKHPTPTR